MKGPDASPYRLWTAAHVAFDDVRGSFALVPIGNAGIVEHVEVDGGWRVTVVDVATGERHSASGWYPTRRALARALFEAGTLALAVPVDEERHAGLTD